MMMPVTDTIDTAAYAITVRPAQSGWSWALIDEEGQIARFGLSTDQTGAKQCALRAVQRLNQAPSVVQH